MIIVDVDPVTFDAASKVFGSNIGGGVNSALISLTGALGSTAQMAGSDEAGTNWSNQYDPAAQQTVAVIGDLRNACYKIGTLLEQTGFNHGLAESRSDPSGTVATPGDSTNYAAEESGVCEPPMAAGGSGSPPTGWGIVEHAVGYVWPNGDSGRLRDAASAWSRAAGSLNDLTGYVSEATTAVSYQKSPEVDDAVTVCTSMTGHLNDTAASCRNLGSACTQLAGYIDTAHQNIENEIKSFIEWSAGIEVVGGLVSIFTLGTAEAPTQAVEAGRIATTAAKIAEFIETLINAVNTVLKTIGDVVDKIVEVASKLKVILGAKISEVVAGLAARLPLIGKDTEETAVDGLSAWDKGWSERGLDIEEQLGGNLPRSFPTIDRFVAGDAESIKSIDLTASSYQNPAGLASRLRSYVTKVSNFDGATWGGREIDGDDVVSRTLHVAIQPGVATPGQTAVLNGMKSFAESKGVRLIVTEVP